MSQLLRTYGKLLTSVFLAAVLFWALMLILLPQATILERALIAPKRTLDSSAAQTLSRDAATCMAVLKTHEKDDTKTAVDNGGLAIPSMNPGGASGGSAASNGGLAVPSMGGMAVPSMGGMAVPSMGGSAGAVRPYILQCDRANTHKQLSRRSGEPAFLDTAYGLAAMKVDDKAPIAEQMRQAETIRDAAQKLADKLRIDEASQSRFSTDNFRTMIAATKIPLSESAKAAEANTIENKLYGLMGLRFEKDGDVYERLGLTNLTRTLFFAILVTALALVICYPIAFKAALATSERQQIWLMLGLIIPYAIVELMRIYAWTTIIDNHGLINSALMWLGITDSPIAFNRSPGTVFVVIAYTYVLFMVFPMLNVMSTLDRNQIEAARDLGASTPRLHWRVIIPHAKPGIAVGCISTFMLAAGAFSVPRIISRGLQAEWFAQTIYNKFFESQASNVGAAYSLTYTLVCFVLVALFMWAMRTRLKDFARAQ
ncbi:ABC transporter permease [Thioclava atlantica]|uniref:Putrescine transport system permease protein PotH n=1 Tax=Thioclava atlantica TaxID=1317124 RepID=A0A085TV12_9RHOB|nr:ABC transporter permease [Thioclava atlantica]KFE34559.1 putrescine transport system permease protein PotH [Thioclava atlantica]